MSQLDKVLVPLHNEVGPHLVAETLNFFLQIVQLPPQTTNFFAKALV